MGYGAGAKRGDAKAVGLVEDVDFYKLGMLCNAERGVDKLHTGIYSFGQFKKACGDYVSTIEGMYVADSFFRTKKSDVKAEMKVRYYVASDAVQATSAPQNGGPNDAFTLKAGMRNVDDSSLFGNKIGYKIENTEELIYTLSAEIAINGTVAILTSVDGLKVGHLVHIEDGTEDDVKEITAINVETKTITFSALTNAAAETVALTTVKRQDITLEIAVKDINGIWEPKEKYEKVPYEENVDTLINELATKSDYLIAEEATVVETDSDVLPADVATWTALTSGSDGTAGIVSDYNTLVSEFDDEEITFLLAPEFSTKAHNVNMLAWANDGYNALYLANIPDNSTGDSLMEFGKALRSTITFGQIPMDKYFEMDDPLTPGKKRNIPNIGIKAAHYFNSYSQYGIGRVSAGNKLPVNTTFLPDDDNGLIHDDRAGVGETLIRDCGVNIGRWRAGIGTTFNSARTLSTDKGYIFENQILGWLLIKRSILKYLRSIEQDPSGADAQEQHYRVIWTYLKEKYKEGVFFKGQREDGSYSEMADVVTIVNDFSINTLADIANGIEQTFVQVVFVPPIEEPILSLASAPVTSI